MFCSAEEVRFLRSLAASRLLGPLPDPQGVLNEPFVNGLGRGRHEHPSLEVGFGEDVGQCGGMVNVEARKISFG
jgi:hypothetical protein